MRCASTRARGADRTESEEAKYAAKSAPATRRLADSDGSVNTGWILPACRSTDQPRLPGDRRQAEIDLGKDGSSAAQSIGPPCLSRASRSQFATPTTSARIAIGLGSSSSTRDRGTPFGRPRAPSACRRRGLRGRRLPANTPTSPERAAAIGAVADELGARRASARVRCGCSVRRARTSRASGRTVPSSSAPISRRGHSPGWPSSSLEADVRHHDLAVDALLDADLHLFHRIDSELSRSAMAGDHPALPRADPPGRDGVARQRRVAPRVARAVLRAPRPMRATSEPMTCVPVAVAAVAPRPEGRDQEATPASCSPSSLDRRRKGRRRCGLGWARSMPRAYCTLSTRTTCRAASRCTSRFAATSPARRCASSAWTSRRRSCSTGSTSRASEAIARR